MIEVKHVFKSLEGVPVLYDVSFELERGRILTVLGPSGSGKTTLLRIIAGLELPDQGEVWLAGGLVSRPGWGILPHLRGIGMAFQNPALWPHMTVAQNILFGLGNTTRQDRNSRLEELLASFSLQGLEKRYPYQLSGGEARRVSLARALAPKPPFLLLDEPLAHLDLQLKTTLLDLIKSIATQCLNLVYVTHDEAEARALGGNILQLVKNESNNSTEETG